MAHSLMALPPPEAQPCPPTRRPRTLGTTGWAEEMLRVLKAQPVLLQTGKPAALGGVQTQGSGPVGVPSSVCDLRAGA